MASIWEPVLTVTIRVTPVLALNITSVLLVKWVWCLLIMCVSLANNYLLEVSLLTHSSLVKLYVETDY